MHPEVDFFIERQTPAVHPVLRAARQRLLTLDDRMREDFKWKTPFYLRHDEVFYLTLTPNRRAVQLSFVRGADLADPAGRLLGHDRKLIRFVRLADPADLNDDYLLHLLHQALLLDEAAHRAGRRVWQRLPPDAGR